MKSRIRRRSRRQERLAAEDIGGYEQPGSGSAWSAKSDARRTGEMRVECKFTEMDLYVLHLADLNKIRDEAVRGGCEGWAMQVDFAGYKMKFAIISYPWFAHLHGFNSVDGSVVMSEVESKSKSTRLLVAELWQLAGKAALKKTPWCYRITFSGTHPPQTFAVIFWDDFIRMKKEYQP